jgi:glycosyltransferase involved in cell wall biosynthesis
MAALPRSVPTRESTGPVLSAVVLCYRAEENVRRVVGPLLEELRRAGISHEVVLVANYRPEENDRTPAVVRELAREHEGISTLTLRKQGAMGWDMRTGLDAARGDHIVIIDGDAQNPVEDVIRVHRCLTETGADLVKGRRTTRGDGPLRRVVSLVYNVLFLVLFGTWKLWDINGKPKGMTRDAYAQLELRSDDWFVDAEIVLAARRHGLDIRELPVSFRANEARPSFVRPGAILEFVRHMLSYRLRGRP